MVRVISSSGSRLGFQVQLEFKLSQHSRDEQLMKSLIKYLNCGNVYRHQDLSNLRVVKFSDLIEKIIPFFEKYKIKGVKLLDFNDFKKVAELIENKEHLTTEGLVLLKIRKIKTSMNLGRKFYFSDLK
jgi:Iap family predicted aminopeptidase